MAKTAQLVLRDGTLVSGRAFGAPAASAGEVVFATGMVGYPEALTDPSFAGQIVVMTYPLIGNYGIPAKKRDAIASFFESKKIWAAGVVVASEYDDVDHHGARQSFDAWLKKEGVPGVAGVDTRALTQQLREHGTILGKVIMGGEVDWYDPNAENIVATVSCAKPETYGEGKTKVVLVDCGAKWGIIRSLVARGCRVKVVPWDWDITKERCDGVFVSNGPGDPTQAVATISYLAKMLRGATPVWGICLGNQLLALAAGAKTAKLPYGHRSQNQPCMDLTTKKCYVTTQNHGFHVRTDTLPKEWKPWFVNVNDATNEGIYHQKKPFRAVQFHPEASPGPEDTAWIFDAFVASL